MVKKTLLSLAIAATTAGLAGCNISSVEKYNDKVDSTPVTSGSEGIQPASVSALFNPARSQLPMVTDFLFSGTTDGTLVYAKGDVDIIVDGATNPDYNPVYDAISDLDGFSTSAAIDIPFTGSLTAGDLAAGSVYLVPLNYTGGPKLGTLDTSNPFGSAAPVTAEVVSYTDGDYANSVVRVLPTSPLKENTRYLVILTNKIKDVDGNATVMPGQYEYLIGDGDLLNPKLGAARTVMQGWYQLATGLFTALTLDTSTITTAYTFTTGGSTDVMNVMAAPGNADAALSNKDIPASVQYVVNTSADTTTAVATLMGAPFNMSQQQAQGIVGLSTLPAPGPRASDFSSSESVPMAYIMDGATSTFRTGSIDLPYYSAAPVGAYSDDGVALNPANNDNYVCADTTNATCLAVKASAANVILGQWATDSDVIYNLTQDATKQAPSENVTNLFPFAKENGKVSAPVLVVEPASDCNNGSVTGKPASGWPVVIFQHGITGNRMQAIAVAEQFAKAPACMATVAIDLPMHGLMPTDLVTSGAFAASGTLPMMAVVAQSAGGYPVTDGGATPTVPDSFAEFDAATQAQIITGEVIKQRHFGLTADSSNKPTSVTATSGQSGSLYIDFLHFQTTRDNNRQAVMDLLNLDATIPFMDIDGDSNTQDFDASNIYFAGISLGSIIGTQFVAVNNVNTLAAQPTKGNSALNPIKSALFAVPGGGLTKLLENSDTFGSTIVGGLAAMGVTQGSSSYDSLMYVYQATVDAADPINYAAQLKASMTPYSLIESIGDTVIPNSVASAPLAGTDPLITALGATQIDTSGNHNPTASGQMFMKLTDDYSSHGSFARPDTDANTTETTATFGMLAQHAISLFLGAPVLTETTPGQIVEAVAE